MSSVKCLSCGNMIEVDYQAVRGDFIECDECGMEFEVVKAQPLKIDWVDYDDDDEFDDDDY